jgi:hypothetical protein
MKRGAKWICYLSYFLLCAFRVPGLDPPSVRQVFKLPAGAHQLVMHLSKADNLLPEKRVDIESYWRLLAEVRQKQAGSESTMLAPPLLEWTSIDQLNHDAVVLWEEWFSCVGQDFGRFRQHYLSGKYCLDEGLQSNDLALKHKRLRENLDVFFRTTWVAVPSSGRALTPQLDESEKLLVRQLNASEVERRKFELPYVHPLLIQMVIEDVSLGIHYPWETAFYKYTGGRTRMKDDKEIAGRRLNEIGNEKLDLPKRLLFLAYLSDKLCSQFGFWRFPSRLVFPGDFVFYADFPQFNLSETIPWRQLISRIGRQISNACGFEPDNTEEALVRLYFDPSIHKDVIRTFRRLARRYRTVRE